MPPQFPPAQQSSNPLSLPQAFDAKPAADSQRAEALSVLENAKNCEAPPPPVVPIVPIMSGFDTVPVVPIAPGFGSLPTVPLVGQTNNGTPEATQPGPQRPLHIFIMTCYSNFLALIEGFPYPI